MTTMQAISWVRNCSTCTAEVLQAVAILVEARRIDFPTARLVLAAVGL